MNDADQPLAALLSKAIAAVCVRNTFLEELHCGTKPSRSLAITPINGRDTV
jgi:hypothetical protein